MTGQFQSSLPCLVDVANQTDRTGTKRLYIPRKLSRYSVYNSTVFNCVFPNKVRQTSAPNSHKCKTSPEKIQIQQPKRKVIFTLWLDSNIDSGTITQLFSTVSFPTRLGRLVRPTLTSAKHHQKNTNSTTQKEINLYFVARFKYRFGDDYGGYKLTPTYTMGITICKDDYL